MLADEMPDIGYRGPQTLGGTAVSLMVYVEDVAEDELAKRAAATHKQKTREERAETA
jgi:PhnB protein